MHLIHLPQLGYTMENGVITSWLVQPGESFAVGDPLYEVETEKNAVQVEARLAGTLARVVAPSLEAHPVGTLLAVVADPGETPSSEAIDALLASHHDDYAEPSAPSAPGGGGAPPEAANDRTTARGDGARVRAVPKVKAFAAEKGVDLSALTGTGPRGSITMTDVEAYLATVGATGAEGPAALVPSDGGPAVREQRVLTGVRRAMAENVARSWSEIPQFVQQFRVDLTAVRRHRAALKADGVQVGLTDVLIAALAHAAQEVPEINATVDGRTVTLYGAVNVAIAVATDRGLLVPVLADAQSLTLAEIGDRSRALTAQARASESAGGAPVTATVTLSNLGQSAVETGTPLVTAPQTAILFAGATVDTPVVEDGDVVVRPLLGLSAAYDHRVVDGITGARFCSAVKRLLDKPELLDTPAVTS
ncbi:dihydrolipoamide acetyltransferase family protein [Cryptosporangium phraense]|uniref:Dihydrolipoamide acetyltransferase component of pyruvate dehydrogenase complex n=1 Tax=Cryptosporangium phraense TaxID=2593070 RepID=A0A545AXV4_9ACTN|nr:dihydrolipoamide acetyltransferase family protein [Cryptosporangium phraense]TQS46162.1 2-oxo acid dehydrogenase subunit E2 [Cryptosporangium phraense]